MKKIIALSTILAFMITISAIAQKLPNVQEKSLRAPATIKVNGKATEWNDQFQAYNKTTDIFYTISNDNEKLYLTVKVPNLDVINKIVCAGVTLTVNGTGKMKDEGGMSVTYPYLNIDRVNWGARARGEPYVPQSPPIYSINMVMENKENTKAQIDTFVARFNRELSSRAKDIKVEGIKEITGHLISIYNPYGIKAAALVDNTDLTYELAIPLKSLGLSLNSPKPFFYNIKLSGFNPDFSPNSDSQSAAYKALREEFKTTIWGDVAYVLKGPNGPLLTTMLWPTDFWGEYTLAK